MKLINTAMTEINALKRRDRRVTRAMIAALARGASKTSHGITLIKLLAH
jgi:hypothetical protein